MSYKEDHTKVGKFFSPHQQIKTIIMLCFLSQKINWEREQNWEKWKKNGASPIDKLRCDAQLQPNLHANININYFCCFSKCVSWSHLINAAFVA
jgi:hypothetical protein